MSSVRSFSPHLGPQVSLDRSHHNTSTVLEQKRILNRKRYKDSLFWFGVNLILLAIILYDLSQTCPMYMNYYHYIEYSFIIILTINVLSYFVRFLKHYCSTTNENDVTLAQRIGNQNPVTKCTPTPMSPGNKTPTRLSSYLLNSPLNMSRNQTPGQITPLNMSAVSWRSNVTPNESMAVNYSTESSPWGYQNAPIKSRNNTPASSRKYVPEVEKFDDEEDDLDLINDYETTEEINKTPNRFNLSNNILSSFWTHPMTKDPKDYAAYVKKGEYQLSSPSPSASSPSKSDDKSSEAWTRINVNTVALTHWNENLRMWISQTILQRLVKEFDVIDAELVNHNMIDVKIGAVGLDRLRKTASMTQILHFIPSLLTVIPFLELHPNQEYLVMRIRDLAKGGCMSDFRWNRGGSFNGKQWDDTLPADCNIVMHLLATYLDTQLLPSPNMPDKKAFSGRYYIRTIDRVPELSSNTIFIQEVIQKPPHYRVIVGDKTYEMVKGYNNLFHSILFFIYQVNKLEQGMLGRVNLGRAGLNMLWIIGLNE
ncbi:unnamed protein product [Ceutorhynchus assimilis]|uniref:Transmembrane protein 209 n=1 Tax=Ceutorhynchus assimilis TaxID=467358 RepID=A0A9N9ML80_9CUCU|nr:unnamed protein product [Ceutorhynchus assimilis]